MNIQTDNKKEFNNNQPSIEAQIKYLAKMLVEISLDRYERENREKSKSNKESSNLLPGLNKRTS